MQFPKLSLADALVLVGFLGPFICDDSDGHEAFGNSDDEVP